jgi:preprotein translocase subunit SecA
MNKNELAVLIKDLKRIQQAIEKSKYQETHLEKIRLLKMIDAELLDALHNMETLQSIIKNAGYAQV